MGVREKEAPPHTHQEKVLLWGGLYSFAVVRGGDGVRMDRRMFGEGIEGEASGKPSSFCFANVPRGGGGRRRCRRSRVVGHVEGVAIICVHFRRSAGEGNAGDSRPLRPKSLTFASF